MPQFGAASLARLATCDQRLQDIAKDVVLVINHTILQGHRNQVDQDKAFAEGKSKLKWPNGNHNSLPSRALDVIPLSAGKMDWNDLIAFGRLMGAYQMAAFDRGIKLRFGMDWDGDFRSVGRDDNEKFLDAPHVELAEP